MRVRLTTERQLRLERLHEKIDGLPDERWKADVVDAALASLEELIDAHESFDGDPRLAKHFGTSVVRPKYRTMVEVRRP